jgi:type IX secretion system PorP/SprF family membrane protein
MKKILNSLILFLIQLGVFAQLVPVTNQYLLNPLTINPAYAGARGALNFSALYRNQWVGVSGAPKIITFCGDAPMMNQKIGVGLMMSSERIGPTKETNIISSYAFRIGLGGGNLSMGLGAGVSITNSDWSNLTVIDPGDEQYLVDSRTYYIPNFSLGLYYTLKDFFAGFSLPQFLNYKYNLQRNRYSLYNDPGHYSYLFNSGYKYKLSPQSSILPSILLYYSPEKNIQCDLNAQLLLYEKLWLGISYRNNRAFGSMIQYKVNNQLSIAYAYDFDLGKLNKYSAGSHELMIRYEFHYKVDVVNPMNF